MNSSNITIAIAEDYTLVRNGIISIIQEKTQHKVVADAENGRELLSKIAVLEIIPDVCLMDISMPVMNGYDTAIALRKLYPTMKILAVTVFNEEYSIIRMITNGANGYLLKNCTNDELFNAITTVHGHGYYYSKTASEKAFKVVKNNHLSELNARELEFLCLCSSDLSYNEIADIMHVSVRTAQDYQQKVCAKLHLHKRTSLALFAIHVGLVSLNKNM